jgi:hypothetical protein
MQQRADGRRSVNFVELAVAFNARVLERWDRNDAVSLRIKTAQTLQSYAAKVSQQGALAEMHNCCVDGSIAVSVNAPCWETFAA